MRLWESTEQGPVVHEQSRMAAAGETQRLKDAEEQVLRMMQVCLVGHGAWPKAPCVVGGCARLGPVHVQHC